MYVLGINPGHDATVALIKDEKVISAIAEERLSRIKNHFGFPYLAIEKILTDHELKASIIDKVVFSFYDLFSFNKNFTNEILFGRGRFAFSDTIPSYMRYRIVYSNILRFLSLKNYDPDKDNYRYAVLKYDEVMTKLGLNCPVELIDHHMSHAASAYYSQSRDKVLVITIDGSGDGLCASVSIAEKGKITRCYASKDDNSPGVFYSAITKYLGFKRLKHEGKITGLAAFGKRTGAYDILKSVFYMTKDKRDFIIDLKNDGTKGKIKYIENLLLGSFVPGIKSNDLIDFFRKKFSEFSRDDIAWAAQQLLEENVVEYVRKAVLETGINDIALAGGVFANVKLNQAIAELNCVNYVYIHPNMSDGGTSFGSAMMAIKGNKAENRQWKDVYLGPSYEVADIEVLTKGNNVEVITDSVIAHTAKLLADGKVIAVMNGRMEYGPRALGNRTILVSAKDKNINDILNKKLKRTEFMPFAPIIMEEYFDDYFCRPHANINETLKYMTITVNVKDICIQKAPAICHVDNTARPQVVNRDINKGVYDILNEYHKITGVPLMVNTSFNVHEEPIVCDIKDALMAFKQSKLDGLLIDNKYLLINRS